MTGVAPLLSGFLPQDGFTLTLAATAFALEGRESMHPYLSGSPDIGTTVEPETTMPGSRDKEAMIKLCPPEVL